MSYKEWIKNKKNLSGFNVGEDEDVVGLDFNIMKQEHENGIELAESCCIPQMQNHFAWKRGFQNAHIGFANNGKTQMLLYLLSLKSLKDNWKWAVWSPEMRSSSFVDGKVQVNYNDLAYDIMATISGKTPHKHIHERFKTELLTLDEKQELIKWIEKHFIFLNPKERKIGDIYELFKRIFGEHGVDGFLIDPFKNIEQENIMRDDKHLHNTFSKFTDLSIETNTVMNWIAHPKSGVSRTDKEGNLVPCSQYMISGGSAWDDSMDGIYSYHRPNLLDDINDPAVEFYNMKQRKQELVAYRGKVENIFFDIKKRRYYFDNYDPIDGKLVATDEVPF